MPESGREEMERRVEFVEDLRSIDLPVTSIVIADRSLPQEILAPFSPYQLLTVEAGEGLKRLSRIEHLCEEVLSLQSHRPLHIVALGGGSIGDAVGFLASILWRGVGLIHIPTTLVAMVDSAHGGKTAVNLGAAKNQLGTFYPAERIIISTDILRSLPLAQRAEGLAELLKGLWLGDAEGVARLGERDVATLATAPFESVASALVGLLRRAIAVKYDIVAQDARETKGVRTFLNFGHTVAHALELAFSLPHGVAVAWGMMAASLLSEEEEGLTHSDAKRLYAQCLPLVSPIAGLERLSLNSFSSLVARDKKRSEGKLRSVLLRAPGDPVVVTSIDAQRWFDALHCAHETLRRAPLGVHYERANAPRTVSLSASKSELNRALLIAHLRPGETRVEGESMADDVVFLRRGLASLKRGGARDLRWPRRDDPSFPRCRLRPRRERGHSHCPRGPPLSAS